MSKKKVVPEPNIYLRRYLDAWKQAVIALAKKKAEQKEAG